MPIIGITASSNQTIKLTNFVSIASTTVGSGGTSQIIFSSIPSSFTHLQIRFAGLTGNDQVLQFNGDTGNNYNSHYLFGQGSSVISAVVAPKNYAYCGFAANNSQPYAAVVDILDYKNTNKNKTIKALAGIDTNSSGNGYIFLTSAVWFNNSAITSIRVFPTAGSFTQNTICSLYGVL